MTAVSRSTYQKVVEENKRLKADIKTLVMSKREPPSIEYAQVYLRWRIIFLKEYNLRNLLKQAAEQYFKDHPEFDINTTDGAMQYLKSEGIDPDKLVAEGLAKIANIKAYIEWKNELIQIAAKETGTQEIDIKINDNEARAWFESGISPYYCFRENWKSRV